ncbi:hypothetical protein M409DRAFT_37193 [Zasmidium cellare ATCC 36951]|uniref:Glutathione S-transferase n=1 Tax=Zasmidium cellare ATCC 36951 TaxID=1080233 RepID=A0A6A6CAE4_ZASCE|nr:uncharacterized protein M409DRAFT_37193 [Zasmidium cellare ATCC 36951]KAF2163803.1 hypothetical protein M409DRAFT_37193 [Zasmidium cellare ATCC 36951]
MSTLKPLTLWGAGGPNPPKVAMTLNLLSLPYTKIPIPLSEVKNPKYTSLINPNGRVPAIQDPNTDTVLWESGAIVEYLVETYDKERKISFERGTKEAWEAKQWVFFQVSGQGPYYGQASWFKTFHAEKLPSAIERYVKEINRVTGVLDTHLSKQNDKYGKAGNGPWLVGDKLSYADVSFVMWQYLVTELPGFKGDVNMDEYPFAKDWLGRLLEVEGMKSVIESSMAAMHQTSEWQGIDKYLP